MNDIFPIELIYKILHQIPYSDVISYCLTNKAHSMILYDTVFWIERLDTEFGGKSLPSHYIRLYGKNSTEGVNIYRRWREITDHKKIIANKYNDIFAWMLDNKRWNRVYIKSLADISAEMW